MTSKKYPPQAQKFMDKIIAIGTAILHDPKTQDDNTHTEQLAALLPHLVRAIELGATTQKKAMEDERKARQAQAQKRAHEFAAEMYHNILEADKEQDQ